MHVIYSAVERSERGGVGGDSLGSLLANQQRSPSPGDPSLESEMAKAVEESKLLKAVVVPLEEVWKSERVWYDICNVGSGTHLLFPGDRPPEVTTGRSKRKTTAH